MPGSFVLDFATRLQRLKALFHHSDGSVAEEYVPDVYPWIMYDTPGLHRKDAFDLMVDFVIRGRNEGKDVKQFRRAAIKIACGRSEI
jgi:hypothetical protein